MALPDSRNTTYAPKSQVLSDDLNDIQDQIVLAHLTTLAYRIQADSVIDDGKVADVSSEEPDAAAHFLSPDGTKLFVSGVTNDTVFQYTLSTAFDINTASYDSKSFNPTEITTHPTGIHFDSTGTKMFLTSGSAEDQIFQYVLTTGFDISTASYDSKSLDFSSEVVSPGSSTFTVDGTKVYVSDTGDDEIHQYTMSTAFDISTASYDSKLLDVTAQDSSPVGLHWQGDGLRLFVKGTGTGTIYRYSATTAFDISTATYDSISLVAAGTTLSFSPDGTKMYVTNEDPGESVVRQFYTVRFVKG